MQDTLNIVKGQKPQNIKTLPQKFTFKQDWQVSFSVSFNFLQLYWSQIIGKNQVDKLKLASAYT